MPLNRICLLKKIQLNESEMFWINSMELCLTQKHIKANKLLLLTINIFFIKQSNLICCYRRNHQFLYFVYIRSHTFAFIFAAIKRQNLRCLYSISIMRLLYTFFNITTFLFKNLFYFLTWSINFMISLI